MNDESFQNMQFLKETIGKFKDEMRKFISDPQYSKLINKTDSSCQ